MKRIKVYIVCPVRNATDEQREILKKYISKLEKSNEFEVFYPFRDAPQDDATGWGIVMTELEAIKNCDEMHIFWDVESKGSHVDLGMAIALNKKIVLVDHFHKDNDDKSYLKVIKKYIERYN